MNLNIKTNPVVQFFTLLAILALVALSMNFRVVPRSSTFDGNKYVSEDADLEVEYNGSDSSNTGIVRKVIILRSRVPMNTEIEIVAISFGTNNLERVAFPLGFKPAVGDRVILHSATTRLAFSGVDCGGHVSLATKVGEANVPQSSSAVQIIRNKNGQPEAEARWTTNGYIMHMRLPETER